VLHFAHGSKILLLERSRDLQPHRQKASQFEWVSVSYVWKKNLLDVNPVNSCVLDILLKESRSGRELGKEDQVSFPEEKLT
jgi:hypothetical protein